jgi:hypothetical protein
MPIEARVVAVDANNMEDAPEEAEEAQQQSTSSTSSEEEEAPPPVVAAAVLDEAGARALRDSASVEVAAACVKAIALLRINRSAKEVSLERQGLGPAAGLMLAAVLKQRAMILPGETGGVEMQSLRLRTNGLGPVGVASLCVV